MPSFSRSGKILLLALVPWAIAEFGPFELYRSALASELHTTRSFGELDPSAEAGSPRAQVVAVPIITRMSWQSGNEITTRLSYADGTEREAHARIEAFELSGPYWAPFWKSGSCRVAATVDHAGPDEIRIEGNIKLSVRGLCSTSTYRGLLQDALNEKITEAFGELGEG